MVKKVDDMTINEYMEYKERMKRQYSRSSGSYFPTYSSHYTSSNNTTIKCPSNTYFNPIQPNIKFNYDLEDMELDEEAGYTTDEESVTSKHKALDPAHADDARFLKEELSSEEDLDEWLKVEMEKHMNECRVVHKNKRKSAPEVDLKKSSKDIEDIINDDNFTSNFPNQSSLAELNPGGFLLPFIIGNYNSYAMTNIDASNNVMPRSICEYLMLANLEEAYIEMIIIGRPFLETIHAQIDVFQDEISLGIGEDRIKFGVNRNPHQSNGQDLFLYGSPAYFQFEQDNRNYDTIDPHNEIVFYDDGSGEDCGMWPTCDPDSKFCYGYKEVFGKNEQGTLRQWFDNNRTPSTTIVSNKDPYKINHPTPIPLDAWETKSHFTYKGSTSDKLNDDSAPFSPEHSELEEKANIRRVNGARFKAMIRKELKDKGVTHNVTLQQLEGNSRDRLDHHGFVRYPFDYRVTLGFGSIAGGLDPVNPVIRLPIERGINIGTKFLGIVGINHYDLVALPSLAMVCFCVLVGGTHFDYIYNPSTNLVKMLPEPDYAHDDSKFYGCAGLGLAFDLTKSPDYKVVRARRNSCEIVIQIYSSETDSWSLCKERFLYFFFVHFDSAIYWNDVIHWLETENRQLTHYKLNIEDHEHPIITTIQIPQDHEHPIITTMLPMIISKRIPHMLHLEGKLFELRGCLVLVRRDYIGFSEFTIYEMTKGCSVWSIKYIVNTGDFMNPLPEGWSIRFIVWSIVLGEREENSFLVINLSAKVVQYNLISNNLHEIYDMRSNEVADDYLHGFIPPYAMYDVGYKKLDYKVFEFIPSPASV
ncbi:hypothetical protein Tco_0512317 [Tanacetum coccineum]